MNVELFELCDYAQDVLAKFTIVSTFSTISPPPVPFALPQCSVVARIRFSLREVGQIPFAVGIMSGKFF
jgi:hypothetical protein